jgi:hypothetical protein
MRHDSAMDAIITIQARYGSVIVTGPSQYHVLPMYLAVCVEIICVKGEVGTEANQMVELGQKRTP